MIEPLFMTNARDMASHLSHLGKHVSVCPSLKSKRHKSDRKHVANGPGAGLGHIALLESSSRKLAETPRSSPERSNLMWPLMLNQQKL